jgi:predicted lipoprotein with Yx(FWY)xxD motif/nitrite reductase/ring-hydroxylating ferredoxin subunit
MDRMNILAAVMAALLVAGCMEADTGGGTPTTITQQIIQQDTASAMKVQAATDKVLGRILTDGRGRTLYIYTKDNDGGSSCLGECAKNWPPATSSGNPVAGDGIRGRLNVINRSDGILQVTYGDMPLYYFIQDKTAGDAKGQGVNGVWYAVNPETGPIMPGAATSPGGLATSTSATISAPTTAAAPGQFIAKTADVPPGTSMDFTYNGDPAILVNIGGTYAAYVNKCTHKGCANKFDGNALTCPCHGSQFDPVTGEALKGPAKTPLATIEVIVARDSVYAG